jgi:hypothetical protein
MPFGGSTIVAIFLPRESEHMSDSLEEKIKDAWQRKEFTSLLLTERQTDSVSDDLRLHRFAVIFAQMTLINFFPHGSSLCFHSTGLSSPSNTIQFCVYYSV